MLSAARDLFTGCLLLAGVMQRSNDERIKKTAKYGSYCLFSRTPNFLRMNPMGQNLVNPNWKRFKPTKAVNKSQYEL
jgi:hypothetical protein